MKHLGVLLSVLLSVLLLAACGGASSSPPGNGGPPAGTPGWALTESLVGPLSSSLSVALGDGRVLLVGGTQASTALRLYDPLTGTWSDGPVMQYTRTDASSAIRLPDGRVAILGGSVGDARTSVEVYDPTTGNVTLQPGTSSVPRAWHAATLLADRRVLVVGGTDGTFPIAGSTAVEIWDPATGLFTATDPTAEARAFSGIARLDDDTVLVIGGDDGGIAKASCERYDPATGTWTSADDLNLARTGLKTTVAVCGDGRVLATGGATSGAELYDPLRSTRGR